MGFSLPVPFQTSVLLLLLYFPIRETYRLPKGYVLCAYSDDVNIIILNENDIVKFEFNKCC